MRVIWPSPADNSDVKAHRCTQSPGKGRVQSFEPKAPVIVKGAGRHDYASSRRSPRRAFSSSLFTHLSSLYLYFLLGSFPSSLLPFLILFLLSFFFSTSATCPRFGIRRQGHGS